MASWFRSVEDFLESVDRTAANVAVPRDKASASSVDDQLAALEPVGIRKLASTFVKEKPAGRSPENVAQGLPIEASKRLQEEDKPEQPLEKFAVDINAASLVDASKVKTVSLQKSNASISRESSQEFRSSDSGIMIADGFKEPEDDHQAIEEQTLIPLSDNSSIGDEPVRAIAGNVPFNGSLNHTHAKLAGDELMEINSLAILISAQSVRLPEANQDLKSPQAVSRSVENGSAAGSPLEAAEVKNDAKEDGHEGSITSSLPAQGTEVLKVTKTVAVQKELDEARGLLKSASSAGQSKEARLAKICASLSLRVQEYKAENAQLEELLSTERDGRGSMDNAVKALQQKLVQARADLEASEGIFTNALAAKNSEIGTLTAALSETKRQAALLEGKLAALQADAEVFAKSRDVSEARMIQALREELSAAERRFEDERAAHGSTRQSATQREIELEQRMTESTAGLTRMQRVVDERTQKTLDLEEKISLLEVECATLNQELQEGEARWKREHKRPTDEPYMAAQVNAWKEEAERARHIQHETEGKLTAMEAETQKLRVELEARKRETESSSVQAHTELEKRFRELTELLYLKQTQLESMASEKQAAQLQLEKEARRFREVKAQAERDNRAMRRLAMTADDEDPGLSYFEALGLQQRRVSPSIEKAAKLLDKGAVTAGRFLWRRPLARLVLLFYFVFVHLFLMYLLHRLQAQADEHDTGFPTDTVGGNLSFKESFP